MKWTEEAGDAVKKVPFFVRKRVRERVEKEASAAGKSIVTIAEVQATQKRYIYGMASEIKGYQLDTCFCPGGCPNRAYGGDDLLKRIEMFLKEEDLHGFLKKSFKGDLKFHHEFRITLSDCPNACSQPQIKDIGIIGAVLPAITDEKCSLCEACAGSCAEGAVSVDKDKEGPVINFDLCLKCGECIKACPTGTIASERNGFRVLLGGKLGRHPGLASELNCILSDKEAFEIVKLCIKLYKKKSTGGKRFAEIFNEEDFKGIEERFCKN
ncbi:MAG: 4Fe-4S dicluster domain-containing protein [Desulfobacteraceae bacterium]|nr:MAG: 4Fe-4S dicluster domain-containing protein [Desulfobacteraceae bacterium]